LGKFSKALEKEEGWSSMQLSGYGLPRTPIL
jgi:hypothetical protein